MAQNSLCSVHGYSAHQLAFGNNPNLPSILNDSLPALEGTTSSVVVGEHIAAMYDARQKFMETECSERIRRALRKQTRTNINEVFQHGDKVFYKRPDGHEWKGPGRVQDGVVVFVRHGGQMVRVHTCRLKKVRGDTEKDVDSNMRDADKEQVHENTGMETESVHDEDDGKEDERYDEDVAQKQPEAVQERPEPDGIGSAIWVKR